MATYKASKYGERIKQLRQNKGFTQQRIADHLGWSQAEISQMENGIRVITLDNAVDIADVLGVSVADIVGE